MLKTNKKFSWYTLQYSWCSKQINITMKTHLNLHNLHPNILASQNQ